MGRTLAGTLGDLRNAGVALDRLDRHGARGVDVKVLAERYEEQLLRSALVDRAALCRIAAHAAMSNAALPVTGPLLLLDVAVPQGDDRTVSALGRIAGVRMMTAASPTDSDKPLDRVRRYLFAPARPPNHRRYPPMTFPRCGSSRHPARVASVLRLLARRCARPGEVCGSHRMAILVRAPELYSGLIETALGRAGITAWFVRGTRVPDPAGRAYLALLACAAEQLSARRFAEYLSLAQVPMLTDEGAPPPAEAVWILPDNASADRPVVAGSLHTPVRWDRLLVESAVIGGRDRWARRLNGMARELRLKRDELAREEPESARVHSLDRDLRDLDHLQRFALPVVDRLAALPERATWGEWLGHLEQLAPMVLKQPDRVLSVLGELRPMSRVGPVPLAEVRDVLSARLTGLQSDPVPRRYGRIFVGRPEHTRGRQFDVVFVPGLAERIFPQKQHQDPLLLDDVRVALNAIAENGQSAATEPLDLPTQDDRASDERLLLRLAVGAATTRLYLSYSRLQLSESRPRVPSFYALDVERARRGRVPDFAVLAHEAYREASARLAWPAPADPGAAIDDTEHDLAVLGPLLRRDVTPEIKGRARYLLTRWALETTVVTIRRVVRPWCRHSGAAWCAPGECQTLLCLGATAVREVSLSVPPVDNLPA